MPGTQELVLLSAAPPGLRSLDLPRASQGVVSTVPPSLYPGWHQPSLEVTWDPKEGVEAEEMETLLVSALGT